MNKERIVFVLALGLLGLGVALTASGWSGEKEFQPPSTRSAGAGLATPEVTVVFADEEEAGGEPGDEARNIFQPVLETVDLPPAELPAPPLPPRERVAPPPYPAPGFGNLGALSEAAPRPGSGGGAEEEDEEEEDGGDQRRW